MKTIRTLMLLSFIGVASTVWAQSLKILCDSDPPAQFLGADGQLTGYTVELVRDIQKRVGNNDPISMVPWARGYEIIRRQPNVVLFLMALTPERAPQFKWIGPVLEVEFGFYAKADSTIHLTSVDDAKTVGRIGVYIDDARDQLLTARGFKNLDRTSKNLMNVKKLMMGRIDMYAASSLSYGLDALEAGYKPSDLKLLLPFQKVKVYIAMSKQMPPDVVESWQTALDAMRREHILDRLKLKYYPHAQQ